VHTRGGQGVQAGAQPQALTAPFPYYGGKRRWAKKVLEAFGTERKAVYAEPFSGSLAVLLANDEPYSREIACDLDGYVANFFRALQRAPDAVAFHADYPTIHQDLTARYKWLQRWAICNHERISEDAEWYDAQAAGWWCWGVSNWIGSAGNFAPFPWGEGRGGSQEGQGVQAQRQRIPGIDVGDGWDIRPGEGTRGVGARKADPLYSGGGGRPLVEDKSGTGVQAQRTGMMGSTRGGWRPLVSHDLGCVGVQQIGGRGKRLMPWFLALADRLQRVVILNRQWKSAVTPTLLQQTPSSPKPPVRVFLDPPYRQQGRSKELYVSDYHGESTSIAEAAYEWAVENGKRDHFAIAYAMFEGDFPVPDGWTVDYLTMSTAQRRGDKRRDCVIFSPGCFTEGKDEPQMRAELQPQAGGARLL